MEPTIIKDVMETAEEVKPLADTLKWMNHDPEPYILTDEEAESVIENELLAGQKFFAWRWADKGLSKGEIEIRLSQMDWHAFIDFEEVLQRANSSKHYSIWQQQQRERERLEESEKAEELKATWTAKQIYRLMCWSSEVEHGKKLIVNGDTLPLIKALCFFLSRDDRFEKELGYSLNKGLLIRGISGLGKTHLVECVKGNELNPIAIFSMLEITHEIKREGRYGLETKAKIIYLDDVGTEETPVNYFGTKINWFKDFLELYYSQKKPFSQLMISTNNSFQQIEEKYGFRVRSRVKDMFNIVNVTGKDLRGL